MTDAVEPFIYSVGNVWWIVVFDDADQRARYAKGLRAISYAARRSWLPRWLYLRRIRKLCPYPCPPAHLWITLDP